MAYGESNGYLTLKGQTRDPNTLRAKPAGGAIWQQSLIREAVYCEAYTVGYPSDNLASCLYTHGCIDH